MSALPGVMYSTDTALSLFSLNWAQGGPLLALWGEVRLLVAMSSGYWLAGHARICPLSLSYSPLYGDCGFGGVGPVVIDIEFCCWRRTSPRNCARAGNDVSGWCVRITTKDLTDRVFIGGWITSYTAALFCISHMELRDCETHACLCHCKFDLCHFLFWALSAVAV